jgi:hypothetical protein
MMFSTGNAATDGAPFNAWFIGDLKSWTERNGGLNANVIDFGFRQSTGVEMKWSVHRAGEVRAAWAPCSNRTTMSLLVRGKFLLRFRSPYARERITEQRLERESDYAVWGTDTEHTWVVEEDSVIFTVRWKEIG